MSIKKSHYNVLSRVFERQLTTSYILTFLFIDLYNQIDDKKGFHFADDICIFPGSAKIGILMNVNECVIKKLWQCYIFSYIALSLSSMAILEKKRF